MTLTNKSLKLSSFIHRQGGPPQTKVHIGAHTQGFAIFFNYKNSYERGRWLQNMYVFRIMSCIK